MENSDLRSADLQSGDLQSGDLQSGDLQSADLPSADLRPDSGFAGKKIFFLYPTNSIKNQIIAELAQNEYEAYAAKDHAKLTRALRNFPDSIIFINIEEKISYQEWENWIGTTRTTAPAVKFGIFSSSNDEEFKNKFIKSNRITCGLLPLKPDMTKAAEKILETLGTMDVKGRRKYLRATTDREAKAIINIPTGGGDFLNGVIKDISVIGVSCVFDHDPGLKKNAHMKDIQIKLQSMLVKVESVVFGSRENSGEKIYVMLFTQRVDPDVRVKIRKYIQQNMQSKMDLEIN